MRSMELPTAIRPMELPTTIQPMEFPSAAIQPMEFPTTKLRLIAVSKKNNFNSNLGIILHVWIKILHGAGGIGAQYRRLECTFC